MRRTRTSAWRRFDPEAFARRVPAAEVAAASVRPTSCRILGLDPGSLRTGWGVLDCDGTQQRHIASGCIRANEGSMAQRLRHIFVTLSSLVQEHRPDEVAIERVFLHRNPDSALKLGQARGVAMCAAVLHGATVFEYAPRAVKLALVGSGNADKGQVQHMVRVLLTLDVAMGLDTSDALALGLCHSQARRLGAVLEAAR